MSGGILRRTFYGASVLAIAISCSQLVRAATIAGAMSEPFNDPLYTGGYVFVNTPVSPIQNSGSGWNTTGTVTANNAGSTWGGVLNAGVLRTATSPGLTFSSTGYVNGTGNALTLDASGTNPTQNIGRTLGGQDINSGTTYFSLLMRRNTADTIRTFNFALFNDTNERMAVGQIATASGNSNGNITLLMTNSNPAGLIEPANPIAMGNSTTHLVIGKIEWDANGVNENVSLWVDPGNVTSEVAAGSVYASTNAFDLVNITRIRPFAGNTSGAFNGVSASFDEIRFGGTWASVTSNPVPEPCTLALACLTVTVFGFFSRRRRAA